ncbi:MAG: hypothetical protein IJ688_05890 [Treponema sp.]|nr:hypothetical protein [Treponema sp.]
MKKINLKKTLFVLISGLFLFSQVACDRNSKPVEVTIPTISFNLSNATALASGDASAARFARSARAAAEVSDSFLQKVLSDGSIQAAFSIEGGEDPSEWGKLDSVIKSPNGEDYILYFDFPSQTLVTLEDGSQTNWYLSQLILVHSDNSYEDILLSTPYKTPYIVDKKDCVKFMNDGSILYVCRDSGGYDYYFNKYEPSSKNTTELCHFPGGTDNESNVYIHGFQISNDNTYIYLDCSIGDKRYLKVFPLSNPDDAVELGKVKIGLHGWSYNPYDGTLYYSVRDGEKEEDLDDPTKWYTAKLGETGKGNPEIILEDKFCNFLVPTAEDEVWTIFSVGTGQENETEITANIQNILNEEEKIEFTIPADFYFDEKYLHVGDIIYLEYQHHKDDMRLQNIYSVDTASKKGENVMKNVPDWENITLASWSVNEESLFISGTYYTDGSAANYKIDLSTLEAIKIDSATAFASIAAL